MDRMLAHQGGWDELLYVLVPIAFIALLLRTANKRAKNLPPGVNQQQNDARD